MRRYLWIYILVAVFVAIWCTRALLDEPVVTQVVQSVEYENKLSAHGYIVRDEVVYRAKSAGMAEAVYQNEERVSKGMKIASIYTEGMDTQTKQALDAINAKIRRLEKRSISSATETVDLSSAEDKISQAVAAVVDMTHTGNFEELDIVQTEIVGYVHIGQNEHSANPTKEALSDLQAQKSALEASVKSAKQDVYSGRAGVFVSQTDGYEESLTPEALESMSVSDFEAIQIERTAYVPETLSAGDRVCKIVDNSKWYFATTLSEESIADLEHGDTVWLRFPEKSGDRIAAKISSISSIENGKAVVVVSCGEYVKDIFTQRIADCEMITHVYDGFQLPQAAVRVDENGDTGVFVNVSGIVHFRKIHILYQTDNKVVAAKSKENGYLKQYDSVIIGGKDIYDGAVVK